MKPQPGQVWENAHCARLGERLKVERERSQVRVVSTDGARALVENVHSGRRSRVNIDRLRPPAYHLVERRAAAERKT